MIAATVRNANRVRPNAMGNYAGTAALLTVFDMQLDPDQPLPSPQL
jgi:hypothetical protein